MKTPPSDGGATDALICEVGALQGVTGVERTATGVRVYAQSADGLLPEIVRTAHPFGLRDLAITEPTLETVFIRLTGRDLRE